MIKRKPVTQHRGSEIFEARIPEGRNSQAPTISANDVIATPEFGMPPRLANIRGGVVGTNYILEHAGNRKRIMNMAVCGE